MPRFFFHLTDGKRVLADAVGRECRDIGAARSEVNSYVRSLRDHLCDQGIHDWSELTVIVMNEKNELMQKMGFDLVSK